MSTTTQRITAKTSQNTSTFLQPSTVTTQRTIAKINQKSAIPFFPITYIPPLTKANRVTTLKPKIKINPVTRQTYVNYPVYIPTVTTPEVHRQMGHDYGLDDENK